MFTLTQYMLDERLMYGVIADILFFGSLWWGLWRIKQCKVLGDGDK